MCAIKAILSSASGVFQTMFYGSMANQDDVKSVVDIDDICSDVFREVLRYIYTDEVFLFNHNICEVIYASHK